MNVAIRLRLTLLYFSFFALAGVLLSLASWLLLERSLTALMLHELDERIDDIQAFLAGRPADTGIRRAELLREYRLKDEGKWLQIIDDHGAWLYFSDRARVADPFPPFPILPANLRPFVPARGHLLRTLTRDLAVEGQLYHVSMAISADRSAAILAHFRRDLWLLVPLVIISAAMAGHFLSRKALDPVQSIVAEVRRINDRNLSTRLAVSSANDELSLLSLTLNEMLERIDSAFRSVRVLTGNASHELRTPLSLIRTRLEIALCFPRTVEYYKTALEELLTETIHMSALVENLLALARYDAGAARTELLPVDLNTLLRKAVREWVATAERLSLDLQFEGEKEPLWVLADVDLVERMLRILVDNACRYTPSGGWVRLESKVCQDRVVVAVEDSGVGIAEQDLPRIFERFFRAHEPQHLEQRGSGLGLALARWIADQHKTSITVRSTVGSGSRFEFSLPQFRPD
jgi:signal transduction histidine kinase